MKKLLIATGSKGKFPEIVEALKGLSFEFLNLRGVTDLPSDFEVEESAMTFEGNAVVKATVLAFRTGLLTLADDSGLEVDALGGKPGVYSARYAAGKDTERYKKVLEEMKDVPDKKRGAQFKCVIAIFDPLTKKLRTCEGIYRGRILRKPRGEGGFGYDPVFFDETLKKSAAEMSIEEKNLVSHRGQALRKAREILMNDF